MTRLSLFNSPLLLGFDHFERVLDQISKTSSDGYPPYNIEQTDDDRLKITLAVAGFSRKDLHVSVEDNQLVVRGKQEDDDSHTYLHHGIAARQFHQLYAIGFRQHVGRRQIVGAAGEDEGQLLPEDMIAHRLRHQPAQTKLADIRRGAPDAAVGAAMAPHPAHFRTERTNWRDVNSRLCASGFSAILCMGSMTRRCGRKAFLNCIRPCSPGSDGSSIGMPARS